MPQPMLDLGPVATVEHPLWNARTVDPTANYHTPWVKHAHELETNAHELKPNAHELQTTVDDVSGSRDHPPEK